MTDGFNIILEDINNLKAYTSGPFSLINLKGKLIISKYSKLITEVNNMSETDNDNLSLYFKNEELVGTKLVEMLLRGCIKYDAGYANHDIDCAFSLLNNECKIIKSKIDNCKNNKMVFETTEETIERLKPFYSEDLIMEELESTKVLSKRLTNKTE